MRPTSTEIVFEIADSVFNIPVRINKVSGDLKSELNESCADCKSDVGRSSYCKGCGKRDADLKVISTYKLMDDKIVISEDSKNLMERDIGEKIQVIGNIPKTKMPIHLFKQTYWLLPISSTPKKKAETKFTENSRKTYARFQRALAKANYGLLVRFCSSSRSRQKVGILTGYDKFMVVIEIPYNEQVSFPIDADFDTTSIDVANDDVKIARDLIENLDEIDYSTIEDSYTQTLEKILTNPTKQVEVVAKEVEKENQEDPLKKLLEIQISKKKKGVKKSA